MDESKAAVAAVLDQAQASATLETTRVKLDRLTDEDCPTVAALLDLVADSVKVSNDAALLGQLAAVKRIFVRLWDDVEEATA